WSQTCVVPSTSAKRRSTCSPVNAAPCPPVVEEPAGGASSTDGVGEGSPAARAASSCAATASSPAHACKSFQSPPCSPSGNSGKAGALPTCAAAASAFVRPGLPGTAG